MRKTILSLALLLFGLSMLHSQNRITVPIDDFIELHVSGRIDAELIPSESDEVVITSRNGQPQEVNVEQKNGKLIIRTRPRIDKQDEIGVKIPYNKLEYIEASAGAVINSARDLEAKDIELLANTGGKIELSLKAENIEAKITQVSDIILYGTTKTQDITVNTGGNYLAYDLESEDSYVKATGGSQAKVTASRKIEATANTKGYIGYVGDPVSTYVKTSLGGEIHAFKNREEDND